MNVVANPKKSERRLAKLSVEPLPQSVLEFESPTAALIATPAPRFARSTIWLVFALVASLLATASVVPIDQVVTGRGKLVANAQPIVLQPLDPAIVRAINVREGEFVHAGQLLAQLDPTFAAADLGSLEAQVSSYQAQVDRLTAEANGVPYRPTVHNVDTNIQAAAYAQRHAEYVQQVAYYQNQINSLQVQIKSSLAQAALLRQRLAVAGNVESMRKELERLKVGSRLNSLAAIDNRIDMQTNLVTAEQSAASNEQQMHAIEAQRDAYIADWHAQVAKDLVDTGRLLADAREQLKKAKLHRQLVELRAPQDAVVMTVAKVSAGSAVQPGNTLLTLVPANAPLEVNMIVLGDDAGYVQTGDPAVVKFDTFPYIRYGYAEGKVRVVSPDSFLQGGNTDPDLQPLHDPMLGDRVFYRARVTLDRVKLHNTPAGFRLVPGMPVTVDIKVGKHTVLDYLLDRVVPAFQEGMREPY
ncbi:MAG: HlyD family type I secretion periplasmic adaptor subunit [Acetobacteraceae bacterium]|nr:HlyD family type I secretion periplasmic adaptor subunit [Acetobacteraceae bacterium]